MIRTVRSAGHIFSFQTHHKLSARSLLPQPQKKIIHSPNETYCFYTFLAEDQPLHFHLLIVFLTYTPPASRILNFSCLLAIKIRFSQCHSYIHSIANEIIHPLARISFVCLGENLMRTGCASPLQCHVFPTIARIPARTVRIVCNTSGLLFNFNQYETRSRSRKKCFLGKSHLQATQSLFFPLCGVSGDANTGAGL